MSYSGDKVKAWRKRTKERMVAAFGGKCGCCDYDRCTDALEYHHLDPDKKDFSMGSSRANIKSWTRLVVELKKCIMVCSNCHKEIHAKIRDIPENIARFDLAYENYSLHIDKKESVCPVCNGPKYSSNITCSRACATKNRGKFNWDQYDILEMTKTMNNCQIAEIVGCSDAAILKRKRKLLKELDNI